MSRFVAMVVLFICQVNALALPWSAPLSEVVIQETKKNHWQLPGIPQQDVQAILPLLNAFRPSVGEAILQEIWLENAYQKELPLSFETQGRFFDTQAVPLTVFASSYRPDNATLHLSIKPYVTRYSSILQDQRQKMAPLWEAKIKLDASENRSIELPVNHPGVYNLELELRNTQGQVVAQRASYFAVRYNKPLGHSSNAGFAHPKDRPLLTHYYLLHVPKKDALDADIFKDFKAIKARGYDGVHVVIHWDDIEIFPGGYDFSELDKAVKAAAKNQMSIGIFPFYQVHRVPLWLWPDHMVDQNGKLTSEQNGRFKLVPTLSSKKCQQGYAALLKNLIKRYDAHPNVSSYHISTRNTEWAFPGVDRRKQAFDYSVSARNTFNQFVQKKNLKLDLPLGEDGKLLLPKPNFKLPDTRPAWHVMVDSKLWELRTNANLFASTARKLTQKDLILYNFGGFGPVENLFPTIQKYQLAGGICSPNVFYGPMINDLYRHAGLKMYQEPSHLAGQAPDAFFFHLLHAGRIVQEVGGIIHFPDRKQTPQLQKRFDHYLPLLKLMDHQPPKPQIAVWFSFDSLMDTSKAFDVNSWWWNRIKPLTRGLSYAGLPVRYVSDYSKVDLKQYKIVMVIDAHLLKQRAVDQLVQYVNHGGQLIVFPETARYTMGTNQKDALHQALDLSVLNHNDIRIKPWQATDLKNKASIASVGKGRVLMFHHKLPVLEDDWHSNKPGLQNINTIQSLMQYFKLQSPLPPLHQTPIRSYVFEFQGHQHLALLNDDKNMLQQFSFANQNSQKKKWSDVLTGQVYASSNGPLNVNMPAGVLRVFKLLD